MDRWVVRVWGRGRLAYVSSGEDGAALIIDFKTHEIEAAETGAPVGPMSVYYDALELNTAIKPHAFRRLMAEPGVTSVTYLDPDIFVYGPLDRVRAGLEAAPLVLIPHMTRPLAGEVEERPGVDPTDARRDVSLLYAFD